jgi:hypothetical protein
MQVGEPMAVAPPLQTPPDTMLEAELVSFTFKSRVKVSRANATITGPHWERGKESKIEDDWRRRAKKMQLPEGPYSKRAAVYLVKGATGGHEVEVKIKITKSQNLPAEAELVGNLWGLAIEGTCPTSVGEHTVIAEIANAPSEIRGYRGNIAWRLSIEPVAITVNLGTTLAEVYFILGSPSLPFKEGVWSEALRFLCGRVGVAGMSNKNAVAARVTAYCHGAHSLRYETKRGESKYGLKSHGGIFRLTNYLSRRNPRCNCYDQAGAVQVFSGAVGVTLAWLYAFPFGFIRPTNLVGVGLCNNPFFRDDETRRIVDPHWERRTAFGNHAFIGDLDGKILDACAKPHLGTETAAEYLVDSIDDAPSLYDGRGFRPGTPRDVRPKLGIDAVV